MGNRQPSQPKQTDKEDNTPAQTGSTVSIPLLRSFLGEAPPTVNESYTDLTVRTR